MRTMISGIVPALLILAVLATLSGGGRWVLLFLLAGAAALGLIYALTRFVVWAARR